MQAEWKDALDFGIRQTASARGSTDEKEKQRYPGRRACQAFCTHLDWDRVDRISLDLADYEGLFFTFEEMRSRPSIRRLPMLLIMSLKKASNLKCLELLDVNRTFLDRGVVANLSTKLERLELVAFTDYIIGPFILEEPSRTLVRAVPSLRFHMDNNTVGVGYVLADIFDATSDTVKDLEVYLDFFDDDLGDEVMRLDDGENFGIVMNRLQVLNLNMDYYLDDAFPLLLSAPNLRKVTVTLEAADYLEESARDLFGPGLRELDVEIGTYTTIEPAWPDLVQFWDSLEILRIRVDEFEGDEDETFDMSRLLSALAWYVHVPLKKLVITGCDKWDGKGLLELVKSRNGLILGRIEPQRLEEVALFGHDLEPSLHEELVAAVPSFSWTPSKTAQTKRPAPYSLRKRK